MAALHACDGMTRAPSRAPIMCVCWTKSAPYRAFLVQVQEDLLEVSWGSAVLALEPCRTVLAGKNEVCAVPQSHCVRQCSTMHCTTAISWPVSACCSSVELAANDQGAQRPSLDDAWQALLQTILLDCRHADALRYCRQHTCMAQHAAAGLEGPLWCRSCCVGLG